MCVWLLIYPATRFFPRLRWPPKSQHQDDLWDWFVHRARHCIINYGELWNCPLLNKMSWLSLLQPDQCPSADTLRPRALDPGLWPPVGIISASGIYNIWRIGVKIAMWEKTLKKGIFLINQHLLSVAQNGSDFVSVQNQTRLRPLPSLDKISHVPKMDTTRLFRLGLWLTVGNLYL